MRCQCGRLCCGPWWGCGRGGLSVWGRSTGHGGCVLPQLSTLPLLSPQTPLQLLHTMHSHRLKSISTSINSGNSEFCHFKQGHLTGSADLLNKIYIQIWILNILHICIIIFYCFNFLLCSVI